MPSSARQWWRRKASTMKDKCRICVSRIFSSGGGADELEVAVIRATSHDDRAVDYKNVGRVFGWARAAPTSYLQPLMWLLARRVSRTRSWPVALKALMLAHGLLLLLPKSDHTISPLPPFRLPFDLSDFRDHRSSSGFSAFVRAYFSFLDHRALLLVDDDDDPSNLGGDAGQLRRIDRLQTLLDLLLQICPYGDGMSVCLVLEAMDCVLIEIFEVYTSICSGIACFLVAALGRHRLHDGNPNPSSSPLKVESPPDNRRRKGSLAIAILRRAREQSSRLSSYLDVCHSLGVLNATELPAFERIPDEDIADLEKLIIGDREEEKQPSESDGDHDKGSLVVPEEWVVFDDDDPTGSAALCNSVFLNSPLAAAHPAAISPAVAPLPDMIDLF